jgi:hypothetical protein
MRWAVHLARIRRDEKAIRNLVEKPDGKRSLGRLDKRSFEDNIKLYLKE